MSGIIIRYSSFYNFSEKAYRLTAIIISEIDATRRVTAGVKEAILYQTPEVENTAGTYSVSTLVKTWIKKNCWIVYINRIVRDTYL